MTTEAYEMTTTMTNDDEGTFVGNIHSCCASFCPSPSLGALFSASQQRTTATDQ
jgi:hypothetical protein